MRTTFAVAALIAAGSGIATAAPFDSGSAGPATPPATVRLGDYCELNTPPARTADGRTAYCAQVVATDAGIWSTSTDMLHVDPHHPPRLGDSCLEEGVHVTSRDGEEIVCSKTENGRLRGNLLWQLPH